MTYSDRYIIPDVIIFERYLLSCVYTEIERLRLIIAKQEIEIERLKKEYFVKGDGAKKEFVITKDVSLK